MTKFIKSILRIFCAAIFETLPLGAYSAQLPPPQIPESVGVNIHFATGHEDELDMIAATGFKIVRTDFIWEMTEKAKGQYDFSIYDELTANLEKRGITPYYILSYANPLYDQPSIVKDAQGKDKKIFLSPQSPQEVAAFANWAGAAAQHFKGHKIIWEVWNEPNLGFWKPKPDVGQYAALLLATETAIKNADPDAIIVAPALAAFDWPFIQKLLATPGVLANLSAVSVHPYSQPAPEYAHDDYKRLQGILQQYANGKAVPVLSGESGYPTSGGESITPEKQAKFFSRQQLTNLISGVPVSIWYDWKNDGNDIGNREMNFGLLSSDLQPKPGLAGAQTLLHELSGYHFVRLLDATPGRYVLLMADDKGKDKIAAWTHGNPGVVSIKTALSPAQTTCVNYDGQQCTANIAGGSLTINLSDGPQYISYKAPK